MSLKRSSEIMSLKVLAEENRAVLDPELTSKPNRHAIPSLAPSQAKRQFDADHKRSSDQRDMDVVRAHSKFIWSEQDEPENWSEKLAKRYWDKLFKEYCLVDLSRYTENKFGMRWRTEKEVILGKGQFSCGSITCSVRAPAVGPDSSGDQPTQDAAPSEAGLRSWEVNFAYREHGQSRQALVKLRLCPACSDKLNYNHRRRDVTGQSLTQPPEPSRPDDDKDEPAAKRKRASADREEAPVGSSGGEAVKTDTAVWSSGADEAGRDSGSQELLRSQENEFDAYLADMLL